MSLKAVLFDFNGVIINDEPIHEQLLEQLLISENLRPQPGEFRELCLGRSDRVCLRDLLTRRGRAVTEKDLDRLVAQKAAAYVQVLQTCESLPIFPDVAEFIHQVQAAGYPLAVVSGALRSQIESVLERTQLRQFFSVIVAGDEIPTSKPEPDGYCLAVERLQQAFPALALQPYECLALEDTFAGIQAAKRAGIPVVGVANSYPFHMLQRRANWAVDYLTQLELDRIEQVFAQRSA